MNYGIIKWNNRKNQGVMFLKNYLICYYILQQCLFESLEEDLGELLNIISPELWKNGKPSDEDVFKDWKSVIDTEKMTVEDMKKSLSEKLSGLGMELEKTMKIIDSEDFEYFISQAKERAEEYLSEF